MSFIIADERRKDLAYLGSGAELDIDIGKDNDFELKINLGLYDDAVHAVGHYLYFPGTEYGGVLEDPESNTEEETISFTGDTYRGMISKKCILPPSGEAYRIISGELNQCIKTIVGNSFGSLFSVSAVNTGVTVTEFQFDRYCTMLDGLNKMLASVNYRLNLKAVQGTETFYIELSAEPIVDYSTYIETSQDSNVSFTIKHYTNKYNYMVCLGTGELVDRMVVYLHLRDNGTVEQVFTIPEGEDVKVYVYDYSSVESKAELIKSGTEKFAEINSTDTQKMTVDADMNFEIGDVVGGRDYVTGMEIKEAITDKIIKVSEGDMSISYTVGSD